MVVLNSEYVRRQINLGVKAHKAGDNKSAWLYFQAALRENPQNVTALLWLAYLSEDYEKCIFLLERVLELDPENKRASAGLAWAQKERAQQEEAEPANRALTTPEAVQNLSQRLKQATATSELRENAKKGTIAQRARRRISP